MVKLICTVCVVLIASAANSGTIWPEQNIKDTGLYYPDSIKVVKIDSIWTADPPGQNLQFRLTQMPTIDTIMARKQAVKMGDLTVLMTREQVRLFVLFLQAAVTDRELKPDFVVGSNWLIGKKSDQVKDKEK